VWCVSKYSYCEKNKKASIRLTKEAKNMYTEKRLETMSNNIREERIQFHKEEREDRGEIINEGMRC